jgi:methylase of polypeptide subunit release factors
MSLEEEILQLDSEEFPAVWIAPNGKTFTGHAKHVASLAKLQPPVSIHGVELYVPPHVYHPGIGLSSRFLVDALCECDLAGTVLDMGCGSGFVGISIHRPGINLVLADVSEAALASASENLRRMDVRAEVVKSDLFKGLHGRNFDAVIFNPPLFDKKIEHEAELALCDPDGELISCFLHDAHDYLTARGKLYFTASNLMNRSALLKGLSAYQYEIIAATHDEQSEVSRWVICAERA